MAADVDHPAGLRRGAGTRGRTDGRDRATDGEDQERGDHRDDEPSTTAAQLAPDLHDHPDRQDGQRRRPDPAQQVHARPDPAGARSGPSPIEPRNDGGHGHPGLRLGTEAGRQDRHEAPAEPEGEQHRPGDQLAPSRPTPGRGAGRRQGGHRRRASRRWRGRGSGCSCCDAVMDASTARSGCGPSIGRSSHPSWTGEQRSVRVNGRLVSHRDRRPAWTPGQRRQPSAPRGVCPGDETGSARMPGSYHASPAPGSSAETRRSLTVMVVGDGSRDRPAAPGPRAERRPAAGGRRRLRRGLCFG